MLRSSSGMTRRASGTWMQWCSPAASLTAITCAAGPSPSFLPSWARCAASPPMAAWSWAFATASRFWECGLLPGALMRNRNLKFICREVALRVETTRSPFTSAARQGQIVRMPIAHGEGCYVADERTLDELEAEDRVLFRYVHNPNGSLRDIAGILNRERNVLGMMPHPERATEPL